MKLTIHTDGGSLNNPGQAACAFLIHSEGKLVHTYNEALGIASNNVAEYTALIRALTYVKEQLLSDKLESVHVFADSELMVRQVTGIYKVKNADIKLLHSQIKLLELEIGIPIFYTHVLREKNSEADALVKEILKKV